MIKDLKYSFTQTFTQKFIGIFFVLIAIYHIIVTILGYGIIGGNAQILISICRDLIWLLFVVSIIFLNIKNINNIKVYLQKWRNVWIWFLILLGFSIGISFLLGQSINDIMIGIKYGFFYLFIFLSASIVGFIGLKKLSKLQIHRFQYFLIGVVVFGVLWQIMKMIKPEMFMNIGYGKFDNFYFGTNPPLYYLTGFEGTTRWQGLFSGPNNYGYFLIAFFPIILLWRNTGRNKLKRILQDPINNLNFGLIVLWILAIIVTLSRSAIIGMVLVFVLLNKSLIKQNKKIFIGILGLIILGIIGLSILKSESTLLHIQAKLGYIGEIIDNPLGHGLGSSGPAIHHKGTMLPENYFMQIMLDIGTVGFIIWAIVMFHILLIFKNITIYFQKNNINTNNQITFLHWKRLYIGFVALLVVGMFLHVFEDSMVNYLFFVSFGLLTGYLSNSYKYNNATIKGLFIKTNKVKNKYHKK